MTTVQLVPITFDEFRKLIPSGKVITSFIEIKGDMKFPWTYYKEPINGSPVILDPIHSPSGQRIYKIINPGLEYLIRMIDSVSTEFPQEYYKVDKLSEISMPEIMSEYSRNEISRAPDLYSDSIPLGRYVITGPDGTKSEFILMNNELGNVIDSTGQFSRYAKILHPSLKTEPAVLDSGFKYYPTSELELINYLFEYFLKHDKESTQAD